MTPEQIEAIARELLGAGADLIGPQLLAFLAASTAIFESASEGDCRACACDVCQTVRGLIIGMQAALDA